MARRGHPYPNVRVVASDLVNTRLASLTSRASAEALLARAARHDVDGYTVVPGLGQAALREDLRRAVALGLGDVPAARVSRTLPVVDAEADEIAIRRELAQGAPLVIVRAGAALVGAVAPSAPALGPSLAARLGGLLDGEARQILRQIACLAEGQGSRAFVVGGVVRDAVAGVTRPARDLDVVIEGDGVAVARRLADATGSQFVAHARFLTASVQFSGGRRVDVATARTEHYEAPGALPRVRPAEIAEDLRRRDFTVNAMAAELSSGAFHLVDPLGGRRDLAMRRLRILHPLSFVEDPTRIFRAGRYAVRLGLALDAWTAAARRLALEAAPFAALSGARLIAELRRALREPHAERVLARLGRDGGFRLFARRYVYTVRTAARLRALAPATRWARRHAPAALPLELLLVVLLADQTPLVVVEALERLGVTGAPRARLLAILRRTRLRPAPRDPVQPRSARAAALRGASGLELSWRWLSGDTAARRRVTRFATRDAAVAPWLDGEEVMALGIPSGPTVGRVLEELRDARLDGTLRDRAAATAHVRRRAGAQAGGERVNDRVRGGVTWRRNTSS